MYFFFKMDMVCIFYIKNSMNGHDMNFLKSGHYKGISTKMVMYAWVYHMLFY